MSRMPQPGNRGRLAAAIACAASVAGMSFSGVSAVASDLPQAANAALDAAKAPLGQLHETRTVHFRDVTVTQYQQAVDGIPVINGEVSVMQSPSLAPTVVGDGTSDLPAVDVSKAAEAAAQTISARRAIAIARNSTGARGLRAKPTAALAIDPKRGLVRRVELASSRPLKDFEVLVAASSGDVLSTRNRLQNATAHAQVYTPNPIANNGGSYAGIGTTRKADRRDHDTAKLTFLRQPVTFDVKDGQDCLLSSDVEARLGRGKGKPVCKSSLNWNGVTRSNDKFEALEAYTQITNVADYYHALGFDGSSFPDFHKNRRQVVIADNFPDDNSFYSPNDRKIRYGTGGVDDAEDGDVVVHEYGHAIQDAQRPGFGSTDQAGALGEGFGDYQSALNLLIDADKGYVAATPHMEKCIFDWDGTGGYGGLGVKPCGRLATGSDGVNGSTNTFAKAKHTCSLGFGREEVHCLGEVWSHGLIDLLDGLPLIGGVRPISVDVITSQFNYTDNETFSKAVNALVAADQANFSGANITEICDEMTGARGIPASACI